MYLSSKPYAKKQQATICRCLLLLNFLYGEALALNGSSGNSGDKVTLQHQE